MRRLPRGTLLGATGDGASGSGIVNFADLGRFRALFGQTPGPSGLQEP